MNLKVFRNYFILLLLVVFLFSLTNVFAEDIGCNDTVLSDDRSFNNSLSIYDEGLLSKTYSLDGSKFSDVQRVVDKAKSGDTICLSGKFTASKNKSLIKIDKRLTITSTGTATFDGKGISGIFNLKSGAKGSVISNLKFINGYRFAASAIYIDAKDVTINNCVFEDMLVLAMVEVLLQLHGIKILHQV